jgi:hypothetical protein
MWLGIGVVYFGFIVVVGFVMMFYDIFIKDHSDYNGW